LFFFFRRQRSNLQEPQDAQILPTNKHQVRQSLMAEMAVPAGKSKWAIKREIPVM